MTNHQIVIDGIPIEILRKPIKNMHIRIYPPDGRVCVSAPLKLNINHIYKQIEEKSQWLHAQRARLQALPVKSELTMQTGEKHYFLGKAYTLTVIDSLRPMPPTIKDNLLLLSAKPNATLIVKQAYLKRWHQAQMQCQVPPLIEKWQPIIGVHVAAWGAIIMKTRWGSCNIRTRHICLNLILIQKPIECLEYVLIHEMVHLLEASHNARFYQLMEKFMPDWRTHKQTLACL